MPIIFCILSRQVRHFCPGKALHQAQGHIHSRGDTTGSDDPSILNPSRLGNPLDLGTLGDNPGKGLFIAGGAPSIEQSRCCQQASACTN